MPFLEPRVSFSSNSPSLFSVMRHNTSELSHLNICMLWTNGSNQCANFCNFNCSQENQPNSLSFFKSQVSFCLNFATPFSIMTHNSSEIFYMKEYMLWTKRAHQCTIFRLLGALMNVRPIPHVFFETTRSGFIRIFHHCSVT